MDRITADSPDAERAAETVKLVNGELPPVYPAGSRPDPQWVRGACPECGDDLVSNFYYLTGKGYLIAWQCWGLLQESPTCSYQRIV